MKTANFFTGIRWQTLLLGIIPTLLMFAAIFSYSLSARLDDAESSLRLKGELLAQQLAVSAEFGVMTANKSLLKNITSKLLDQDVVSIEIFDHNHQMLTASYNSKLKSNEQKVYSFQHPIHRLKLKLNEPSELELPESNMNSSGELQKDKLLGVVSVHLSSHRTSLRQQEILYGSLSLALIALLISAVLAFIISHSIIKPLITLAAAVQRITTGDYNTRVNISGANEIKDLQNCINSMASSLEQQQEDLAQNLLQLESSRQAAEQANRSKSEFLATMSHELRTPMNGALGMLALLRDTQLTKTQLEFIDTATASTQHLLVVVSDILDFSRIESGHLALNESYFSLERLLHQCRKNFSLEAEKKGLKLELTIAPILHQYLIKADEDRLQQILINLISNALKFTSKGCVCIIASATFSSSSRLSLNLCIKDTGIGIEEQHLDTIFNSFQQADSSTVRQYGGSGLGLAIVKSLCQLMEGDIDVSSTPNQGASFCCHFEFDCKLTVDEQATKPLNIQKQNFKHLNILVVEDNQVNQLVLVKMLSKLGAQFLSADNGEIAVDLAQKNQFDLIFMDCQMPIMDGFETTQAIRNNNGPNQNTPIVALTANALTSVKDRCFEVGMNNYLSKPVTLSVIIQELKTWSKQA